MTPLPRFIRLRDAPSYLGMDRNRFNAEVRPSLTEIPIGRQGVAFDRLDLDQWADTYKRRKGRPGANPKNAAATEAERTGRVRSPTTTVTSRSRSVEIGEFTKALEMATSKRRRGTSHTGSPSADKPPRTRR
jgi:hypothetical protein